MIDSTAPLHLQFTPVNKMRIPQYHEHMGIDIPGPVLAAEQILKRKYPDLFHDIAYLRDNGYWYSMALVKVSMFVHGICDRRALTVARRFINPDKKYKRPKQIYSKGCTETSIVKAGTRKNLFGMEA